MFQGFVKEFEANKPGSIPNIIGRLALHKQFMTFAFGKMREFVASLVKKRNEERIIEHNQYLAKMENLEAELQLAIKNNNPGA